MTEPGGELQPDEDRDGRLDGRVDAEADEGDQPGGNPGAHRQDALDDVVGDRDLGEPETAAREALGLTGWQQARVVRMGGPRHRLSFAAVP